MGDKNFMKKSLLAMLILFVGIFPTVSLAGQTVPKYGLVYGSDTDIERSDYEIKRFRNNRNLPQELRKYNNKSSMFVLNNLYRSVLLFNTKKEARNAQPSVEKYLNNIDRGTIAKNNPNWSRGSYVVDLNRWCRPDWNSKKESKDGINYYNCQPK